MNYNPERRGSRLPALERSLSYSEAINSTRSSISIPNIVNTDVYYNEELKKQQRLSQNYVDSKETAFPAATTDYKNQSDTDSDSSDEEHGLVMTIDVEDNAGSPKSSETRDISDVSTRRIVSSGPTSSLQNDFYDRIEVVESVLNDVDYTETIPSSHVSTPFTRRKRKGTSHRRRHGRPIRSRRVVHKNGEENVPVRSHIPAKSIKYMRDIVNTVINSKWRFLILMMVFMHCIFWLAFAGIWYWVATSYQKEIGDGMTHCVNGTASFAGMLMMSVETQMTIGYGVRFPNEECPEAIVVMVFEIVAGTALSGGLSSLLFTKLIRPNRHVSSVGFSKRATICLRDGELCLQFRVWDLLNVHIINSTITAYMLKPIRTLEGELVQNYMHQLELKQARAFLMWPITVVHVINSKSPLYDLSAQDMMDYRFEIVVCLTGSSKSMGTVTQSRTSYLSKEINWGYRFKNVIHYSKQQKSYIIDVDNLNSVEVVETPLCSASRLKTFEEDIKSSRHLLSTPTRSLSPTNMSVSPTDCFDVKTVGSINSSPSLNRMAGTQRSFGWNFRRFQPENYVASEIAQ